MDARLGSMNKLYRLIGKGYGVCDAMDGIMAWALLSCHSKRARTRLRIDTGDYLISYKDGKIRKSKKVNGYSRRLDSNFNVKDYMLLMSQLKEMVDVSSDAYKELCELYKYFGQFFYWYKVMAFTLQDMDEYVLASNTGFKHNGLDFDVSFSHDVTKEYINMMCYFHYEDDIPGYDGLILGIAPMSVHVFVDGEKVVDMDDMLSDSDVIYRSISLDIKGVLYTIDVDVVRAEIDRLIEPWCHSYEKAFKLSFLKRMGVDDDALKRYDSRVMDEDMRDLWDVRTEELYVRLQGYADKINEYKAYEALLESIAR